MFDSLELLPPDAIIGLIAEYKNDGRDPKVDLGIGVYRDATGATPVLRSVKTAEKRLLETQDSKAYLGSAGSADFNAAMRDLAFANSTDKDRVAVIQTPGGSGSLRVAAGVILRTKRVPKIWVSTPTWANHRPLLGGAGLTLENYPYYDPKTRGLDFDAMVSALKSAPEGDIVLLHACCHNPTGVDPDRAQWQTIADVVVDRGLIPFVDMAYQGFAADLDDDAFIVRHLAERVPQMIVSSSCSKNFGLYRDRVGALMIMASDPKTRDVVQSQANNVVRTMYSMPPDHGAAVVAEILGDDELRQGWLQELTEMRNRLQDMRRLLHRAVSDAASGHDFDHLVRAKGMFSFLGLSPEQVRRVKADHAVYMINSSRINLAGITPANVEHVARAIAAVL